MREIKRFQIGSRYFFGKFEDYASKDNDFLVIMDDWKLKGTYNLNLKDKDGNDIFFYKNMNKEEFIEATLKSNVPMRCGKFLVKEFNEYIGFEIKDLKRLEIMFNKMDKKHQYEKSIYDFFIKNNSFDLDEDQLLMCYNIYKQGKII